jgi:hypothetical protein
MAACLGALVLGACANEPRSVPDQSAGADTGPAGELDTSPGRVIRTDDAMSPDDESDTMVVSLAPPPTAYPSWPLREIPCRGIAPNGNEFVTFYVADDGSWTQYFRPVRYREDASQPYYLRFNFRRFNREGLPEALGFCETERQCERVFSVPRDEFREVLPSAMLFAQIDELAPDFRRTRSNIYESDDFVAEPYLVVQGEEPDVVRIWRDLIGARWEPQVVELVTDVQPDGTTWRLRGTDGTDPVDKIGVSLNEVRDGWELRSLAPNGYVGMGSVSMFFGRYDIQGRLVEQAEGPADVSAMEWNTFDVIPDVTHVYDGERLIRSDYNVDFVSETDLVSITYEYDGCER